MDDLIRREDALLALGMAAWKHEGEDAYSKGLDAGARQQSKSDYDAIRALPAAPQGWQPPEDQIARAICREACAFYGESPCFETGEWPNDGCDSPGCIALAKATVAAFAPLPAPVKGE